MPDAARMTLSKPVSTVLPDGTVTRTLMSAVEPNEMASVVEPPPETVVQVAPPSLLISTVKPAGTVGAESVNVSFALPAFCTVLVNVTTPTAFVLPPGGTLMPVLVERFVKSSLLLVGPTACGAPEGPMKTEPTCSKSVGS